MPHLKLYITFFFYQLQRAIVRRRKMTMKKKKKSLRVKVKRERMERLPPSLQGLDIPAGVKMAKVHG